MSSSPHRILRALEGDDRFWQQPVDVQYLLLQLARFGRTEFVPEPGHSVVEMLAVNLRGFGPRPTDRLAPALETALARGYARIEAGVLRLAMRVGASPRRTAAPGEVSWAHMAPLAEDGFPAFTYWEDRCTQPAEAERKWLYRTLGPVKGKEVLDARRRARQGVPLGVAARGATAPVAVAGHRPDTQPDTQPDTGRTDVRTSVRTEAPDTVSGRPAPVPPPSAPRVAASGALDPGESLGNVTAIAAASEVRSRADAPGQPDTSGRPGVRTDAGTAAHPALRVVPSTPEAARTPEAAAAASLTFTPEQARTYLADELGEEWAAIASGRRDLYFAAFVRKNAARAGWERLARWHRAQMPGGSRWKGDDSLDDLLGPVDGQDDAYGLTCYWKAAKKWERDERVRDERVKRTPPLSRAAVEAADKTTRAEAAEAAGQLKLQPGAARAALLAAQQARSKRDET